ncbi:homoserine dehydrogenase [Salinicoccus sp. ID82-1]|uniref:homoserine dehydrogenase n=1 Tax=Salinicoccus sp. ID82-1 TaxID=2820269 RepID=UPI001F203FBF|nr:homoserine dehydrogenase [Salinicoccus sp. ID82-1]MCG1008874.1 homoserine dehydrogenase [Salinicoccus sp. ID82-1]
MNLAILGMGTVGCGIMEVLSMNREKITGLIGEEITVSHVFVSNVDKKRDADLGGAIVTDDINSLLDSDGIDAVIEVMGGMETTRDVLRQFLEKGIHVISANKDMLAKYIDELALVAEENDAKLLYEASIAGGIPIVNAIEHGLNANQIHKVMGILNGTTNYILSKMTKDGWDYARALDEAKEKGYAEADPTNDVDGFDAQRKIVLLSRLAYGRKVDIDEVPVTGIRNVELKDIRNAGDAGLKMKLVGKSEFDGENVSMEVAPVLLPDEHQLASVEYEKNAVYVMGNAVGETMFYGPGAGGPETASAVVSDLINCARSCGAARAGTRPEKAAHVKASDTAYSYYIRFSSDEAAISNHLAGMNIGYRLVDAADDTTVITGPIGQAQLKKLKSDTQHGIRALYQVEGN